MGFKIEPFGGSKYTGDYADYRDINQYFGFRPNEKVPPEFTGKIELPLAGRDGTVLAEYFTGCVSSIGWRGKTAKHRVFVGCPDCDMMVPAGRVHQHKCKG